MNKRERVILREIKESDVNVLMELNNNEEIAKYVVGNPKKVSLEEQMKWMQNLKNEKNSQRFMIEYDNDIVGTIIVNPIDYINKVGNMNIKILPKFQGKHIAKYALMKACDFSFDSLDLFCLTANILSYNEKSKMLFKKIGFHQDGILRCRVIKNGIHQDLLAFSMLKTERIYAPK